MSPPVIHLPLDLSGTAVTNKVTAELHMVAATGNRAIATRRGPYFTRGMIVRNRVTGTELTPDVHYRAVHFMLEAGLRAGQEICAVVLILPATNATEIEIDYQAIGGEYSASVTAIEQMLEGLDLDNRTVYWGDLIGVPEYFPPTAHLHDIGDVYGFEYIVAVLEQIRRAILQGDQAAFDELRQYIDLQDNALRALITANDALFADHINNTNNPHQTTKAQVGLGNVENYAVASQAEAQAGSSNSLYMTPLRVREAITQQVGTNINAHIANTNNPHATTKAQVGLSNVVNYGLATTAQAQAGSGEAYMTATLTGAAILALATTPMNAHIARTDNPHSTTKAQVGLSNVDNYATASGAQAAAGTATNLFVTPAGVRAAITAIVGDGVAAHIADMNNPHNTNKTQVGLGSVDNARQVYLGGGVGMGNNLIRLGWDGNQILAQVDSSQMGRVHTTAQPDPNIAAHANRTDNPHATTAAQVGLGQVNNWPHATQAQAEAGSNALSYMSPLRTAQAITALAINPLTAAINNRVVIGSNGALNTLTIGPYGYLYYDGDGSVSLRVNGNRYFQFQASGNMYVANGRVIAAQGFQPSDKRLKKDIVKLDARPLWRGLSWKTWTHKETQEVQSGFVAQDIAKIAPDRVTTYDHRTPAGRKVQRMAVDYTGVGAEMAYAAGLEVDRLREQVESQQSLIESLSARLAALEAKK